MAGISATGFIPKTLAECIAERQVSYRATSGDSIDLDESSPYGQQNAIDSEREAAVWALGQAIYDAFDPANAEDDQLDAICRLTGTSREGATYSTMTVRCTGDHGTVLQAGRVVSVQGSGVRFASVAAATIADMSPSDDYVDVLFRAEETGPLVALAGALVIETPVAGWDSAQNLADAVAGQHRETCSVLRVRREVELRTASNAALEAIRAAVSQVAGVDAAVAFENSTDVIDADGLPPHSVEVVVSLEGGADEEAVRLGVYNAIGAGIRAHGGNSGSITDSSGGVHTVAFTEASEVNIYESCTLIVDAEEYPSDGDTQVATELLAAGHSHGLGRDVRASRRVMALKEIPGILDAVILVDTANPPLASSVEISLRQVAKFDSSRIAVTSTPGTP